MKTLKSINVIHDNNYINFPQGAILDETINNEGTPVVRAVYNDVLQNVYKIVSESGILFNNLEDGEQNGYQLYDALRALFSSKNSVEYSLLSDATSYRINYDLSRFENKSFIIARATEDYDSSKVLFKGNSDIQYSFYSQDFKAGDELLIIIDILGVRAYNLSDSISSENTENSTISLIDYPLQYIKDISNKSYIFDNFVGNQNKEFNVESIINSFEGSTDEILLYEAFAEDNEYILFVNNVTKDRLFIYSVNITSNDVYKFTENGFSFDNSINNDIQAYYFDKKIALTNYSGSSTEDFLIQILSLDLQNHSCTFLSNEELGNDFIKTSNGVCSDSGIYTLVNNVLNYFPFGGVKQELRVFNIFSDYRIFRNLDSIFLTNGNCYFKINAQ